jgi:hypothetical protein
MTTTAIVILCVACFALGAGLSLLLLKSRYEAIQGSVWVELATDEDDEAVVVFRSFDRGAVQAVQERLGDAERSYTVMSMTRQA